MPEVNGSVETDWKHAGLIGKKLRRHNAQISCSHKLNKGARRLSEIWVITVSQCTIDVFESDSKSYAKYPPKQAGFKSGV